MSDLVGKTLGKYEIVAQLGSGGMADVYGGYPLWSNGKLLSGQTLFGSDKTRNAAWGDPAGVNTSATPRMAASNPSAIKSSAKSLSRTVRDSPSQV